MKVQDFAYQVCKRTMDLLEHEQHYKISESHRKDIQATIRKELNGLIEKSMPTKKK